MNIRKFLYRIFGTGLLITTLSGCSDEEASSVIPTLITEFAEVFTDEQGNITHILPDYKDTLYLENIKSGFLPSNVYRGVCTYTPLDSSRILIRQIQSVKLLHDSTSVSTPATDPIQVVSVWEGGDYLNFRLEPKTQGGEQYWGYRIDSISRSDLESTLYLTLHHRQNKDPESYTQTIYASIWKHSLDSLIRRGDRILVRIQTYQGIKNWEFRL